MMMRLAKRLEYVRARAKPERFRRLGHELSIQRYRPRYHAWREKRGWARIHAGYPEAMFMAERLWRALYWI